MVSLCLKTPKIRPFLWLFYYQYLLSHRKLVFQALLGQNSRSMRPITLLFGLLLGIVVPLPGMGSTPYVVPYKPGNAATFAPSKVQPPKLNREFRGAWVASVANIDWPSTNSLTVSQQKAELVAILNRAQSLKLNAVIFQVRPACDALYPSKLEPWSEYLTGVMGRAPQPYYDPLEFALQEAHQRGLELHAWFNPYRARHRSAKSPLSPDHIGVRRPSLVKKYGDELWLDPGEKEVQEHSLKVVLDVLERYDVDGLHFDDYFYPYKVQQSQGQDLDFPDDASWQKYGARGKASREDWRRENVNTFIQRVYTSVKQRKPWVKFGLSPFGIWRPGYPPQVRGYDAYDKLYADSRKWLQNGWLDYFAPQLYWQITAPEQSYPVLLKWWVEQNPKKRFLWPGLNTANTPRRWKPEEIVNQVNRTRQQSGASGHIHWNMRSLMRTGGAYEALSRDVYSAPAIPPAMTWLDSAKPGKPKLTVWDRAGRLAMTWNATSTDALSSWILQTRRAGAWKTEMLPAASTSKTWSGPDPDVVALTAVDRYGNASSPVVLQRTAL